VPPGVVTAAQVGLRGIEAVQGGEGGRGAQEEVEGVHEALLRSASAILSRSR